MPIVKWNTVLRDVWGDPIKDGTSGRENKNATLATVACSVLLNTLPGDDNMPTDKKMGMYRLAQSAVAGGDGEVSPEDIVLLRERVGKGYAAGVVGPFFDALDGKAQSGPVVDFKVTPTIASQAS